MLSWLSANIGTVLITLLLIAVIVIIIVKLRKDKKRAFRPAAGNAPAAPCMAPAIRRTKRNADNKKGWPATCAAPVSPYYHLIVLFYKSEHHLIHL